MSADGPIANPAMPPTAAPGHPDGPQGVEIDSLALLGGQREVVIRHGSECYRLRHTRNDKLILTK